MVEERNRVKRNYLEKRVGLRKVREDDLRGGMEHDQNIICLYENRTMKYIVLIINRYKHFFKIIQVLSTS